MLVRADAITAPILDLGCGTGILGIAAAKALRLPVIATDIDPVAVAMAATNVRLNGVLPYMNASSKVAAWRPSRPAARALWADLCQYTAPDRCSGWRLPIAANLALGAPVILSGLLQTQEQQVLSAYLSSGFVPACAHTPRRVVDADLQLGRLAEARRSSRIMSAAFSAIMITGELVLPLVMVGITEASTTRNP